jgi:hypothetical protein
VSRRDASEGKAEMNELREVVAREMAVYLTRRRDVLDAILAGNAELGKAMITDLAERILAIPEIAEALAFKERADRPNDPNSVHGIDHWAGH